ncbi:MAG: VanZ family protein [Desulfobacterales bacterium]
MKLKLLTMLALIYGLLLVYASLMPFDFSTAHFAVSLKRIWTGWPLNPGARISGSDVVSNLVLYLPLGWLAAVRSRFGRTGLLFSMASAALLCSVTSAFIELLQAATLSRTASGADWLLNTISGLVGAAAGAAFGRGLWVNGIRWVKMSWHTRPTDIATLLFMGLLAADAMSPYLPTILLKQVWRSLKHSHFDLAAGLSLHPWHWWVFTRGLVYAVLTLLLAAWGSRQTGFRRWIRAFILAAGFALILELVKPMILSRSINMANVAVSWLGCLGAVLVGPVLSQRIGPRSKLDLAILWLLTYIVYLAWTPFHFAYPQESLSARLPGPVELLPLYHYAKGARLEHARLFVQSVFLLGVVIYLIRVRFGWLTMKRVGVALAALSAGVLALVLEGGQLFLPTRTPSVTDIYCFALGGVFGAWIRVHPSHVLGAMKPFAPGPFSCPEDGCYGMHTASTECIHAKHSSEAGKKSE